MKKIFSRDEVKLMWAYSEVDSEFRGSRYSGALADRVRLIKAKGVTLEELHDANRHDLRLLYASERGSYSLGPFLEQADEYEAVYWNREHLASSEVVNFVPLGASRHIPMQRFFEHVTKLGDPQWQADPKKTFDASLPIIVGIDPVDQECVVIDGFHRSVQFLSTQKERDLIRVLCPSRCVRTGSLPTH